MLVELSTSSTSVGAVSSLAGRAHTSKCARSVLSLLFFVAYTHTHTHTYFLSFSLLVVRPLDIRRCPGHVIPLRLPSRIWHRFSWEEEDGKGQEGRRRKKTEQESSAKCDYRRLAESFGFASLLRRVPSFRLPSLSRSPASLSPFFTSFRGYRRDVPTCTSRSEERKTWVLIRACRGCGSSRHYLTENRLPLLVCARCLTCASVRFYQLDSGIGTFCFIHTRLKNLHNLPNR